MSRYAKPRKNPDVPKVERIELDEKLVKKRVIIVVLAIILALVSFGFGIAGLLKSEGWTTIEVDSSVGFNCGDDFTLNYYIDSTATKKALIKLYSNQCKELYELFDADQEYQDINNIYYINRHPNEIIKVDERLYRAFEKINKYDDYHIYLGPIYQYYDYLFYVEDEAYTFDYDPIKNDDTKEYFKDLSSYIFNISIELLGDNNIRLNVSGDYLEYQKDNSFTNFIDFYYLKNAFIIDELADTLIDNNFTFGSISSNDGYVRTLDNNGTEYGYQIINLNDGVINKIETLSYSSRMSIVFLHNYPISDDTKYYTLIDNEFRHRYLNLEGIPKTTLNNLVVMDKDQKCSDLLLSVINEYICGNEEDEFDTSCLEALTYVYFVDNELISNYTNWVK